MSSKLDRVVKTLTAQVRKILEAEFPESTKIRRVLKDGKLGLVKASAKPALAVAPKTGKSGPQMAAATLRKQVLAVLGKSKKVSLSASQVCERIAGSDQRKVAAALKALCKAGEAKMLGARSGARYARVYPKA